MMMMMIIIIIIIIIIYYINCSNLFTVFISHRYKISTTQNQLHQIYYFAVQFNNCLTIVHYLCVFYENL